MPEVIEVKTYVDFIKQKVRGKRAIGIEILAGRYKKHGPFKHFTELKGELPLDIVSIESKGKYMYIKLSNNMYIGVTLGLTGGWFWNPAGSQNYIHGLDRTSTRYNPEIVNYYIQNALKHLNVVFKFAHGNLYFYDQLSFGTISILTAEENDKRLIKIGPDILSYDMTLESFKEALRKPKNTEKPIGNVLMDQSTLAGVGNYLRADALWMSKISPFRHVKDLSELDMKQLYYNLLKLVWGIYNYKKALRLGYIGKYDKMPTDYGRDFFIYMNVKDIRGRPVTKEKLYEGSQIRYIYWVKSYQT